MDIDKFVPWHTAYYQEMCFGSLMDIDKFVPIASFILSVLSFGSLMDIDKFVLKALEKQIPKVSVL